MRWLKFVGRALIITLLLPAVVGSFWLTLTEDGLRWAYHQASLYIPGELSFSAIEGNLIGPVTIRQLDYRLEGNEVQAESVELDWSPLSLLGARVMITRLQVQSLKVIRTVSDAPSGPFSPPEINLPWQLSLNGVVVDDIQIEQAEQVYHLKQLRLDASSLFNLVTVEQLFLLGDTFELDINGSVTLDQALSHKLNLKWQGDLPGRKIALQGKGKLEGNIQTVRVQQQISGPLNGKLQGELKNLMEELSWQANIDISQFNSQKLDPVLPALKGRLKMEANGGLTTITVKGDAQLQQPDLDAFSASYNIHRSHDNLIKIESLSLYRAQSETRLNVSGEWQPPIEGQPVSGDVALKLEWEKLRWPIKQPAWFNSATGHARLKGNIDRYTIDLTTDRPWQQLPDSSWHMLAKGSREGMDIEQLNIKTLEGVLSSSGRLNWVDNINWQATTLASNINPGLRWPDWPGSLSSTIKTKGKLVDGDVVSDIDIDNLTGRLRGNPLSVDSRLKWQKDELTIDDLKIISGLSSLTASGQLGSKLSLEWTLLADDLNRWLPQAGGHIQASGKLQGSRDEPDLKANIKGQGLYLQDLKIRALTATVEADVYRWNKMQLELLAESAEFRDISFQSLKIEGTPDNIKASITSAPVSAQLELKGNMVQQSWQGELQRADIKSDKFADWKLIKPVKLQLSKNAALIEQLCLSSQQAVLCSDIEGEGDNWKSQQTFSNLPLQLFDRWLPQPFSIEGSANGTASVNFEAPLQLSAVSEINFPGGRIKYQLEDGDIDSLEYQKGKILINLEKKGFESRAELNMVNDDQLLADVFLPGLQALKPDLKNQAVKANVTMNIRDYSLLEGVVPEVRDIKGETQLKVSVAGTLGQPALSGNMHFLDGSARIPRLGLFIEQINMRGQSDQFKHLNFDISARSGDGSLTVNGKTELNSNSGWLTTLNIVGDSLEVSRIPEARVQASPNLKVNIKQRNIDISGEVLIPYARLQPRDITTATRVSGDVVIVGREAPAQEKWKVTSKVRLVLGERVTFFGFGFEGRFDGSLLLEDSPGKPTIATGNVKVPEGRYRAYGQNLEVEDGRLLFTGGPVTNPGLDLRAVRRVNEVIAGLRVKGTLNDPQIELFSVPAMGQTDALSYLLLGRPIENASNDEGSMMAKAALALSLSGGDRLARNLGDRFGLDEMRVESSNNGDQASLVIGRYLSPKLYVSYGVGLIDSYNTLNIRYQLTDKWQLKGESGETQGADLLYTIER